MTKQIDYRIAIKTAYNSSFTITSVLSAPRQCRPVDVKAALSGIELVYLTAHIPGDLAAVVSFILIDFFALAHSTGLYNRQKMLWESIGRAVQVDMVRPRRGLFFKKSNAPWIDLYFRDTKGNILLFASMSDPLPNISDKKQFIKGVIARAEEIHKRQGFLHGIFLAIDSPIPASILDMVERMTNASDPVGKYESLLPVLQIPLNILRVESAEGEAPTVTLAHPYLKACVSQSSR
jgi:hypothetical protein